MKPSPTTYRELEARISAWGKDEPGVQAAIVVGSRARTDHPADEWSDLDLILFVERPERLISRTGWLDELGEVWLKVLKQTGGFDPEWLVFFAGGLKADFVLSPAGGEGDDGPDAGQLMAASPYQDVFERGVRLLFDKNGTAEPGPLPWMAGSKPAHPTQKEFAAAVDGFLLQASRVARFLRRGDLWRAKQLADNGLKERLLAMLAWQARARYGLAYDTWYNGRFLDEWADPEAIQRLPGTFALYEADSLWGALFSTLELYRWLARDTAGRLGYDYPETADGRISGWMQATYEGRRLKSARG